MIYKDENGEEYCLNSANPPIVSSRLSELVQDMIETTERFQKECHDLTKEIIEQKPKCTVQDATNVWLFKKLAEFEVRLRQLEFIVQP